MFQIMPRRYASRSPLPTGHYIHRLGLKNLLWRERYARTSDAAASAASAETFQETRVSSTSTLADGATADPGTRPPSHSRSEWHLPLRQDLTLREDYVNAFHGLRLGKLLEDLDAFAAAVAYVHCLPSAHEPVVVTARCDRVDLLAPLSVDQDIRIQGEVTWTGHSSMEVTARVWGEQTPLMFTRFTLVAKRQDGGKFQVPTLVGQSDDEREQIERAKHRRAMLMQHVKERDLTQQPPTDEECKHIHQLWCEQRPYTNAHGELDMARLPPAWRLPSQTRRSTTHLCHPQDRNIHGSIFGGFLMRTAFELAYTTAATFIHAKPFTLSMSDVEFKKPVPIGSVLMLQSEVTHADGEPHRTFQVSVVAEVRPDVASTKREVTNVFHFTFYRGDPSMEWAQTKDFGQVPRLIPTTYQEAMNFLSGRRRKGQIREEQRVQREEFLK